MKCSFNIFCLFFEDFREQKVVNKKGRKEKPSLSSPVKSRNIFQSIDLEIFIYFIFYTTKLISFHLTSLVVTSIAKLSHIPQYSELQGGGGGQESFLRV